MQGNSEQNRSAKVERNLQNIANAATVVGAVVALLSDQLVWLLPAAAAIAFMTFALQHRRWGAALISLLIVAGAGFVGISSYFNLNVGLPSLTPKATHSQTAQTTTSAITTTQPEEEEGKLPKKLFDGEVTLDRYDSADIDASPAQIAQNQDGAVGDGDIYFDPLALPGALYPHSNTPVYLVSLGVSDPERAYDACTAVYNSPVHGRNASPFGFVSRGSVICFRTSQDHMAWVAIAAVNQPIASEPAASVVLQVIVWSK